jgi:hypothetical protein
MHAWRYRKQINELATGEVFASLPIRRVLFCEGTTASIMPADLWRGRSTVGSVLRTVVHALRQGVGPALEWAAEAGAGEEPVCERTVRRWTKFVTSRVVGSAFSWLGPRLGWAWSDARDTADQLERLLRDLTGDLHLAFRAASGYGVLDHASVRRPSFSRRSSAQPVPGRLAPAPPHDPPSICLARGTWWRHRRRGPPREEPS